MKPVSTVKVQPKRIKTPRIVHHQEDRRQWQLLLLLALLLVIGWQAYSWGVRQGGYDSKRSSEEITALKTSLAQQQTEIRDLEAEAVRYRRQAEIEQQANRELQQQMVAFEDEKAALESEVEMLRSLVSNDTGSLYIKNFTLRPTDEANLYQFAFTIVQVMEKVKATRGKLVMKLSGKLKGKKKRLDYEAFSNGEDKAMKLEFSNYEDVTGQIVLPEGFEPESILIEFLPRNKELKKMSKTFSWSENLQGTE
ncbi:DUF6776 family protein [Thiolapillus sp.]